MNEGVVSVDDLLQAFDEMIAEGAADPAEAEQGLRVIAGGFSSQADADKIERHLDEIHR